MVTRTEEAELPGQALAGGHRATCWDTTRVTFIREEAPGDWRAEARPTQSNRAHHTTALHPLLRVGQPQL